MTEFMELVRSRRSVRKFTGGKIERGHLEICVEAARYAPSACNVQPWKFVIVDDPQKTGSIVDSVFSGPYSMNAFARGAAAFIAIVSEKQGPAPRLGGILRKTDFRLIDIGMACEHLALQARELNIGTCILGWFDEKKLKKILSVPFFRKIELVIALGYPASDTEYRERPLKDRREVVAFNEY
ncbi:MAG: nitroreductase family protein [Candidatus Omnitrophica bacterium]|nr:nitroreductase family protein [Candidatus Omnitrophota bacterium]